MRQVARGVLLAVLIVATAALEAHAWTRSPATTFATLPAGATNPEGITVDGAGNVYVTTFAVGGRRAGWGSSSFSLRAASSCARSTSPAPARCSWAWPFTRPQGRSS